MYRREQGLLLDNCDAENIWRNSIKSFNSPRSPQGQSAYNPKMFSERILKGMHYEGDLIDP